MSDDDALTWANPSDFCEYHKGNTVVRRCCHKGDYYVSEMRLAGDESGFIDYVYDGNDWIVEDSYFRNPDEAQRYWEAMLHKMMAGQPPERE